VKPVQAVLIGSTAPSLAGLRNLVDGQEVARGPVSASPSPMTQATIGPGLSNTGGREQIRPWESVHVALP
jgi:hypothetical protein